MLAHCAKIRRHRAEELLTCRALPEREETEPNCFAILQSHLNNLMVTISFLRIGDFMALTRLTSNSWFPCLNLSSSWEVFITMSSFNAESYYLLVRLSCYISRLPSFIQFQSLYELCFSSILEMPLFLHMIIIAPIASFVLIWWFPSLYSVFLEVYRMNPSWFWSFFEILFYVPEHVFNFFF